MMRSHLQRGPQTSPSGRLGSGVLSQPAQPSMSPGMSRAALPAAFTSDDLSDLADLAPTEPQLPSMPKLPRLPRLPRRASPPDHIALGRRFSEYMLAQDWTHHALLASVPLERRMRLFTALAPVYLTVVQKTGRMDLSELCDGERCGDACVLHRRRSLE